MIGESVHVGHNDRPALGGSWYEYDPDTHAVTPHKQIYLLRENASGFMRYTEIGGLTWKSTFAKATEDTGDDTLVIASSHKTLARRLTVPGVHLGEVRHYLRDKIGEHAIAFDAGPGLHLGTRDTRESI